MNHPTARPALEAALAAARATVASIEAALTAIDSSTPADELLDLPALRERYSLGRAAVLGAVARGELVASRGARGRILVSRSEVERWIASRPVQVTPRERANVTDLAEWERRQRAALDRAKGGRS